MNDSDCMGCCRDSFRACDDVDGRFVIETCANGKFVGINDDVDG